MVVLFLPLLFPDGRLLSWRWWLVIALGLVFAGFAFAGNAFSPGPVNSNYPDVVNPFGIRGHAELFQTLQNLALPFGLGAMIGSISSVVVRYRRADGTERRQLRWFLFALVLATIPFVIQGSVPTVVAETAVALAIPLLPVGIAIAVLRYRLYEIDVVINRTLVYGALAAFITLVYIAIVVGIGTLLGTANRASVLLSIFATGVVAVAFQPVHLRVQRIANRLVYGKRATPYEVMAGFGERMAATLALDEVLPQTAEAAARGVSARAARARLFLPNGTERASSWPPVSGPGSESFSLPVRYQGQRVGEIEVEKGRGEALTRSEQALLADLAAQAGVVLHNLRLAAELEAELERLMAQSTDLQASRQRIVAAQESQRRRLEAAIRDGVEAELRSIDRGLEFADRLLDGDLDQAIHQLEQLGLATQQALDGLRELARGIFPPILGDRGFLPALQAQLRKMQAPLLVDAPGELENRRFNPEVETALYFTCLEALTHATPNTAIRVLEEGNTLIFSISPLIPDGEMLDSRDRIAAVGGVLEAANGSLNGRVPI